MTHFVALFILLFSFQRTIFESRTLKTDYKIVISNYIKTIFLKRFEEFT